MIGQIEMVAQYDRPSQRLADELEEVQSHATALSDYLKHTNLPLPHSFPQKALLDLTSALTELPNGTTNGARNSLSYAQERLAAVRGEHILKEDVAEKNQEAGTTPRLLRREALDDLLVRLLGSVSTALQIANRDVADPLDRTLQQPEASVVLERDRANRHIAQKVLGIRRRFTNRRVELDEIAAPNSANAERLRRQITDVMAISRIVHSELAMPRTVPAWLRRIGGTLQEYPQLIVAAATAMQNAADGR